MFAPVVADGGVPVEVDGGDEHRSWWAGRSPGWPTLARTGQMGLNCREKSRLTMGLLAGVATALTAGMALVGACMALARWFNGRLGRLRALSPLLMLGSESAVGSAGKKRMEAKEYELRDGGVCSFRFPV